MSKYIVNCWETVFASFEVEAKTEDEALEKAYKRIEEEGMPEKARVFNREYDSATAQKVKGLK